MTSFNAEIKNTMSFIIEKTAIGITGFVFAFTTKSNNLWTNMKLSFMISSRADLELGSVSYQGSTVSTGSASYALQRQWDNIERLQVVSFLTAFEGQSNSGSIGYWITGQKIRNNVLVIQFTAEEGSSITKLTLDLVVFDPFSRALRFQLREITSTFLSSTERGSLPDVVEREERIEMFGLNSFVVETSIHISMLSSLESGQGHRAIKYGPLNEGCLFNYLSISYLVVAFNPCGFCEGTFYIYNDICLEECPFGTAPNS